MCGRDDDGGLWREGFGDRRANRLCWCLLHCAPFNWQLTTQCGSRFDHRSCCCFWSFCLKATSITHRISGFESFFSWNDMTVLLKPYSDGTRFPNSVLSYNSLQSTPVISCVDLDGINIYVFITGVGVWSQISLKSNLHKIPTQSHGKS